MTSRVLPSIVVAAVVAAVVLLMWPVQRHHMFAVAESGDSTVATPVGDGEPVTPIQVLIDGTRPVESSLRDAVRGRAATAAALGGLALVAGLLHLRLNSRPKRAEPASTQVVEEDRQAADRARPLELDRRQRIVLTVGVLGVLVVWFLAAWTVTTTTTGDPEQSVTIDCGSALWGITVEDAPAGCGEAVDEQRVRTGIAAIGAVTATLATWSVLRSKRPREVENE